MLRCYKLLLFTVAQTDHELNHIVLSLCGIFLRRGLNE